MVWPFGKREQRVEAVPEAESPEWSESGLQKPLSDSSVEGPSDEDFWLRLAWQQAQEEKYEEALETLKTAESFGVDTGLVAVRRMEVLERQVQQREAELTGVLDTAERWLGKGNALFGQGCYGEAIASYDKTLEIKPDDHKAWYNRGLSLFNLGRYEEAIASYDKALEVKPDYHEAWTNRGNSLANLGRYEEALASSDKALEIKPDFHEAWTNRGNSLDNLGRYEEALASSDQALEIKPDSHEAWYNRGVSLGNLGRYEEALASYDKALEIKPDSHEAWYNRGVSLGNLGRYEEALASYDKALEIKPDFHKAWYNRGVSLGNLGRYEEAIASYDKALKLKPDDHKAWTNRGISLGSLGRYEEAIASYDKALEIKPDLHEAWTNRGNSLNNLGRYEEALASSDKALEIKPDSHEAWYNRGVSLGNLGRYEEALASSDKALEIKPDDHEAWTNRGNSLANLGRDEEAIASYDKALEIKPDFHEAWTNRGNSLNNLGRYEEALASSDKALEIKPDSHEAWYNRGVSLGNLGRYEEALASSDKALEIKPDFHEAWTNRGNSLDNLGRYEEALASYDKALEIKPDLHEAWGNRGATLCDHLGRYEEAIASSDKALEIKPDFHEAWTNRGIAAKSSTYSVGTTTFAAPTPSVAHPHTPAALRFNNPHLNKRGYPGQLASLQEGLRQCPAPTHPLGHGYLQHQLGETHRLQGNHHADNERNPTQARQCWHQALTAYQTALTLLTPETLPKNHPDTPKILPLRLEVLQSLIRLCLTLHQPTNATAYRIEALRLFQTLLNQAPTTQAKQRLETQFSGLSHIAVDSLIAEGQPIAALETAEFYKNRRLTWILDHWQETITSPSHATLRQLIANPTHHRTDEPRSSPPKPGHAAVVYWHLSTDALTTFLLLPHHPDPILLDPDPAALRHRQHCFNTWRKTWDAHYRDYRAKGKDITATERKTHPWRTGLSAQIQELRDLLGLPEIETQYLQGAGQGTGQNIDHLILIPHRDLHCFPLHACFDDQYRCTYLPSLQTGLSLQAQAQPLPNDPALLCIKDPIVQDPDLSQPPLLYSALEAAILRALLPNGPTLDADDVTQTAITAALQTHQGFFHFTGHGTHNYRQPEQSALQLSDGLMDARAIAQLNLKPYCLAAIAACETALSGNQTLDQEYVGLTSAFLKAGAANVLSTLWQVDEIASTWLVIRFYQILLEGSSPGTALHQAQQWLREIEYPALIAWISDLKNRGNLGYHWRKELEAEQILLEEDWAKNPGKMTTAPQPYMDPFYWAGFILTGGISA